MVGTGFNDKINKTLFSFLEACYEGLINQVNNGMPQIKGLALEIKEIDQYKTLLLQKSSLESRTILSLLVFLENAYKLILDQDLDNLDVMIASQKQKLLQNILRIETKHKQLYGSIWEE